MIDYRKLIDALETISRMCFNTDDCEECPCGSSVGDCLLHETDPNMWNIVEPEKVVKVMR